MSTYKKELERYNRRRNRSKKTAKFHESRLRLCVFRSNKHISVQLINDFEGLTLVSASSNEKTMKSKIKKAKSKIEVSKMIGALIAERALDKKIENVVFDRNGYPYHGRLKALAEAAREGGLKF